ncbi:hypothetical protein PGB90_005800 [Kerria lacca]
MYHLRKLNVLANRLLCAPQLTFWAPSVNTISDNLNVRTQFHKEHFLKQQETL